VVGIGIGMYGASGSSDGAGIASQAVSFVNDEQREFATNFRFVSPLLSCGVENNYSTNKDTQVLRERVGKLIETYTKKGTIAEAGVYYRELNDGTWFGIHEDVQFTPGSLLKVPLALSLLRKADTDPAFASSTVRYEGGAFLIPQHFPPTESMALGRDYSLTEAMRLMLVYSDNIATQVLAQMITMEELEEAYKKLGIEVPTGGDGYTMSVRTYASFFRILYNGTYLTHSSSDALLAMLTDSSFLQGIAAGVPKGTVVAHKFGERTRSEAEPAQLHDCGIVYKDKRPYALCVMLRGKEIDTLPAVIADISKTIFDSESSE
jgi:beta-lactamase class A